MKKNFIIWIIANACILVATIMIAWIGWGMPVHWDSSDKDQTPLQWWWDFEFTWSITGNGVLLIILLIDLGDRAISKPKE